MPLYFQTFRWAVLLSKEIWFKRTRQFSEIEPLMFAYSGLIGTHQKQGLHCNVTLM